MRLAYPQPLSRISTSLTTEQETAYNQLKAWLDCPCSLYQQKLSDAVRTNYTVAYGQIPETSLWFLASLPVVSDRIFIGFFQEAPFAFFDFIAQLDALSETADHIGHGHSVQINQSVFKSRDISSAVLCEFHSLCPDFKLREHKRQLTLQSGDEFTGLVVIFSKEQQSHKVSSGHLNALKGMARNRSQLTQIALPPLKLNFEDHTYWQQAEDPEQQTAPVNQRHLAFIEEELVRPLDIKLIKRIRRRALLKKAIFWIFLCIIVITLIIFYDTIITAKSLDPSHPLV